MALCNNHDNSQNHHECMEFTEDDHGSHLLTKLRAQRADEKYCDMVLHVEDKVFKAHRNVLAAYSPYFDTMCNSGLEEDKRNMALATVECTSAEAMELILDYMYTGKICINADNVESILRGADPFLMSTLKDYCHKFLWQNLDASNCLVVRNLADLYRFDKLHQRATQFIRNQFMQVLKHSMEDFVRLSFNDVLEWITDDKIRVEKEESISEMVVKWVRFDLDNRRDKFPRLLVHVRLAQLEREYLITVVEKEVLVTDNKECAKQLAEAMHQTDTTRRSYCSDSPVLKPRKGRLTDVVVITGGVSENGPLAECYGYIVNENRWTSLPGLPSELRFHAVATLHGFMYAAGGSDSNRDVSNHVHSYDPITNSWSKVAPLQTPREYLSLVSCNGHLYAFGGIRWDRLQQSVERYDSDTNKWAYVSPMLSKRYAMQVTTVADRYIYAIAGRDSFRRSVPTVERYDTYTNEWTTIPSIPIAAEERPWEFPVVESYQHKIYVTDLSSKVYCLDTKRNVWTEEKNRLGHQVTDISCLQYCTSDRNVFLFGGWDACVFNQKLKMWSSIAPPPASTLASACCVLQVPYEFLSNEV
ncbi:kelch-like protein 11 [Amphiura filiformis]|uniref:kelch-like protein 11 n=1 Tax=Amphiura filiformis TaxID=82378 RepID=UPI003B2204CF